MYARIGMLQVDSIIDALPTNKWEEYRDAIKAFKENNRATGLYYAKEFHRIAWDLYQVVRHRLAWDEHPEGGIQVYFDEPHKQAKSEELAKMKEIK